MMKKLTLGIFMLLFFVLPVSAQKADAILGKWLNPSGEGQVEIYKKGDNFFGKLCWIKFPNDAGGRPKTDVKNPDASLRTRPELGLELLKDFTFNGNNVYEGGTIYDPKSGKTYSCKMTIDGKKLKIRGYVGVSLFGRTEEWTRVE